ncbi:uncharacterized protein LOC127859479 isoform X1 [Dreissena polymorpha]|uniref:uncharacterized protein LOC127859479 isoform X1 n=1 Tax=Dreissena polymorpha TaxID=45954 RepID=UPI002264BF63|nr:uncharacterized protein LOC127859479 isoform X1 [Dreissena polymorpha]
MDNNQHSSAFSLSNFKNNILDDDSDDDDDDDSDAYDNNEKDFGESRNVVDHMVRDRDGDVRQLGQARLSPEITDAKQTAMNELGWEMLSSIGEKSHRLFEDGIACGVNGKREQRLQENPANSVASNSSTSKRRPYNKNKLSTTKNNEKDDFSTNLSPIQNIKPVTDSIKGDMSATIDFNPDLTRKFHQDYASGHEIANARSPFTGPVSIAIPAKPTRTNKNASKSDRMNPKTDEATVTHTAMRWDITDGDLKKLSAYTLFSSHLKQNRRTFSWHGYIPADAPNFKLPQLATPYKIRPKFKHKMTMFFPIVHVAKVATSNEMDDDVIVANLTSVGITQYVPCMQCFASGGYSGGSDAGTTGNTFLQNGKCPRCGVSLISSLDAVKALRRLQSMFKDDNVIVQDVRNDGNCLFAAVVDQLRTQGNAEHDIYSLRVASVEYLRTHPFSEDGTRLDVFLVDETWEEYLMRMCRDGEWGDHMILNAIAEILQMNIIIYGGIAEQQTTRIVPKSCPDEAIKGDVRIAHLLESHYVSLRAQDWMQKLDSQNGDNREITHDVPKEKTNFSIMHFDMIVSMLIQCEYLQSLTPTQAQRLKPPYQINKDAYIQIVGDFISEVMTVPYVASMFEGTSISHFFSNYHDRADEKIMPIFYIPHDTLAQFNHLEANRKGVVITGDASQSRIQLRPIHLSLWKCLLRKSQEVAYIKTFELSVDVLHEAYKSLIVSVCRNAGLKATCIIAFNCEWPECALEWVSRSRPSNFPSDKIINSIYSNGCNVVPYLSQPVNNELLGDCLSESKHDSDTHWCISFAISERVLFQVLSREHKCCFMIFRTIVEQAIHRHNLPSSITKSVFFYACENLPETYWNMKAGQCLLMLLRNIANAFSVGMLAHYFISTRNMLHGLSLPVLQECALELNKCWTCPIAALDHALETLNIKSSDFQPVLDMILDDIPEFIARPDAARSFVNCFYPSHGYLIQMMVTDRKYEQAVSMLQAVKMHFENVFARPTDIHSLFKSVLSGTDMCTKWVFAFFTDLRLGTRIAASICSDQASLHISEVFGPRATELLIDTHIPEDAGIENGNLLYAEEVSNVLRQLKKDNAFIVALTYYLERYSEHAGDSLVIPARGDYALSNTTMSSGMVPLVHSGKTIYVPAYIVKTLIFRVDLLHVDLYNRCLAVRMLDEYRPLFPTYQAIAKLGLSDMATRNEQVMGLTLGKDELFSSRLMEPHFIDQYMDGRELNDIIV